MWTSPLADVGPRHYESCMSTLRIGVWSLDLQRRQDPRTTHLALGWIQRESSSISGPRLALHRPKQQLMAVHKFFPSAHGST
jgi:hypothetical protein